MKQGKLLYAGKAKSVYRTDKKDTLIVEFRDDITAFDGGKKDTLKNKGSYNAGVSAFFFEYLEKHGVKTHFLQMLDDRRMAVRTLSMIPLEVIVRNVAAGSIVRNYPFKEGTKLDPPVIVIDFKDDSRHDPMLNDDLIVALKLATPQELTKDQEDLPLRSTVSCQPSSQSRESFSWTSRSSSAGREKRSVSATRSAWTRCASGTKRQKSRLTRTCTASTKAT